MTTLTTYQQQKAAEFENKLAYKFDHKQGCSLFSDTAKGPMCTCGVMKDALDFLTTAIAERDRQWVEKMSIPKKTVRNLSYIEGVNYDSLTDKAFNKAVDLITTRVNAMTGGLSDKRSKEGEEEK